MEEAGDQTRIVTTCCHQRSLITDFIHHPVTTKNQPSLRMLGINKNHRKNPDSQLQRLCYPQIEKVQIGKLIFLGILLMEDILHHPGCLKP